MAEFKHEQELLNSSSDTESDDSCDEVDFHLPVSEVVIRAYFQTFLTLVIGAAAVASLIFLPMTLGGSRVIDLVGCVAFGYIFGVFAFQSYFLEWPKVPCSVFLLLLFALAGLLGPTALHRQDLWAFDKWYLGVWIFDVLTIFGGYMTMVRGPSHKPLAQGSLTGKVFVITGCNTGIGYETAKTLAEAGATVVFACRTESKARAAMQAIVDEGKVEEDQLVFVPLDTSDLANVRRFPDLLEKTGLRPHTLILNAGAMFSNRAYSKDGLEMTLATNHFGHFLMVQKLLPAMLAAEGRGEKPRIVIVGSNMSYMHSAFDFSEVEVVPNDEKAKQEYLAKPFELFRAYGQSKLANLWFTTELARRLKNKGSKIPVNQLHPGEVLTEVMRDMNPVVVKLNAIFRPVAMALLKTPPQGAFCTLFVATDPSVDTSDKVTGAHFLRCQTAPLSRAGADEEAAAKLWKITEEVCDAESLV